MSFARSFERNASSTRFWWCRIESGESRMSSSTMVSARSRSPIALELRGDLVEHLHAVGAVAGFQQSARLRRAGFPSSARSIGGFVVPAMLGRRFRAWLGERLTGSTDGLVDDLRIDVARADRGCRPSTRGSAAPTPRPVIDSGTSMRSSIGTSKSCGRRGRRCPRARARPR